MKRYLVQLILASALVLMAGNLWAQSLNEAASQAARQHDAKVLSAHTEQKGNKRVHVIKLLTKDGVVKTVRVTVRER
jgi:outer membrane lipoprotein-sorting protein